jgi:hypothetical protein
MRKFDEIINKVIQHLLESKLAEKKEFIDDASGKKYFILLSPDALDKEFVCVIALGYPEKAGVWSNSLLGKNLIDESSMEPYFRAFNERNWGLVAINPHFFKPDRTGSKYVYQLEIVLELINSNSKLGIIGFSMGGYQVIEFLGKNKTLLNRIVGIVLIDPAVFPNTDKNLLNDFKEKTILFAAKDIKDVKSLGNIASNLFNLPAIKIDGIHGEVPNKSLDKIIEFYEKILQI